MKVIYLFLRVAGLFFLVWLLSACSEGQQGINSDGSSAISETPPTGSALVVYKSPTCGCCEGWVQHLESSGFAVDINHPTDLNHVKSEHGIDPAYQSCHTAVGDGGYVFEGHIPAKHIQRFLNNPPADAIGLAVPGMPLGSPGMEMNNQFSPYHVLLLKKNGSHEVFAQVNRMEEQY